MNGRRGNHAKPVSTEGRVWLAEPFILNRHGVGYGETRAHSIDEPAPTANCDRGGYVVEPIVVNLKGQSTATDVDAPLPTQTAHAGHLYVAEPLPTITTGGAGCADPGCARPMLAEPFVSRAMAKPRRDRSTSRHYPADVTAAMIEAYRQRTASK